jgi:hypothetical protein
MIMSFYCTLLTATKPSEGQSALLYMEGRLSSDWLFRLSRRVALAEHSR